MESRQDESPLRDAAMMRGSSPAKIDSQGRIKIPTTHRKVLEQKYGSEFYVTSLDGKKAEIYPMEEWLDLEARMAQMPKKLPERSRFELFTGYYGQVASVDKQGRLMIPPLLRAAAQVEGEVVVIGKLTYLEVWNHEQCLAQLLANPLTDADLSVLAEQGL